MALDSDFDLLNSVNKNTTLFIIPNINKIHRIATSIVKLFVKKKYVGIYVCLNKPCKIVKNILKENKVDTNRLFFIDCITPYITNHCDNVYVCLPNDLSRLSIVIHEFVNSIKEKKYIIIDALAVLLIYNQEKLVIKFVNSLIELAKKSKTKLIVLTQDIKKGNILDKIVPSFDEVLRDN